MPGEVKESIVIKKRKDKLVNEDKRESGTKTQNAGRTQKQHLHRPTV